MKVYSKMIHNLNESKKKSVKNHIIYCSSNKMVMRIWSKNAKM